MCPIVSLVLQKLLKCIDDVSAICILKISTAILGGSQFP
jgi:hypothetical protein